MLRFTVSAIIDELSRRDIKHEVVDVGRSIVRYRHNNRWRYLRSSVTEYSSPVGVTIADNKNLSSRVARELGIPVPAEVVLSDATDARNLLEECGEIVIKPADASHGNGVTTNIIRPSQIRRALKHALNNSRTKIAIAQQMIYGHDARILIIDHKAVAITQRIPASVTGDGKSTIEQLIKLENANNPNRGQNDEELLAEISLDSARRYLGRKLKSVPKPNQVVQVVGASNLGAGGISKDITNTVPQSIKKMAEKLSREINLPVCGVDFIAGDIKDAQSYCFLEINACPGFGLHFRPVIGEGVRVDIMFVDYLMEQS